MVALRRGRGGRAPGGEGFGGKGCRLGVAVAMPCIPGLFPFSLARVEQRSSNRVRGTQAAVQPSPFSGSPPSTPPKAKEGQGGRRGERKERVSPLTPPLSMPLRGFRCSLVMGTPPTQSDTVHEQSKHETGRTERGLMRSARGGKSPHRRHCMEREGMNVCTYGGTDGCARHQHRQCSTKAERAPLPARCSNSTTNG